MAFSISKEFVLLCEGPADRNFFQKLFKDRGINNFDVPEHQLIGKHYGWASLGKMILALSGDPTGYAKLKGILLVADSGNRASTTFSRICRKIKEDGPFGQQFVRPTGPSIIAKQRSGHPPLAVMLIPHGATGALETICVQSIVDRKPWLKTCVESYLQCGNINAMNWPPEARAKAQMQCIIAALNKDDPNKGLGYMFSVQPPLIHFRSKRFTPIVRQIKKFCDEVTK